MIKFKHFLNFLQILIFIVALTWIISSPPRVLAVNPEEIYVQPVPGLKGGLFGITAKKAIEALMDDNYQVFCAAPTQEISPEVVGEYRRFLELYFDLWDQKEKEIVTKVTEPGSITNPLITDRTGDSFKKESAINYKYRSKTEPGAINASVVTDGTYRLENVYERCVHQVESAKETISLCQKLDGVLLRNCALNKDIPSMTGIKTADISKIDCEKLKDPSGIEKMESWELQAIANAPDVSAADSNTRPAWLAICFNQTPGNGAWFDDTSAPEGRMTFWQKSFWTQFFQIGKHDECYIKYITVPAAITEKNPYLEDHPLEVHDQAKTAFLSLGEQQAEQERFNDSKAKRKSAALAAEDRGFSNDEIVNLKEGEDEFKKVLAYIINGTAVPCSEENVRAEEAPTIGSDSTAEKGGAKYKDSQDDAFGTWSLGGIFSKLTAELKGIFLTGKRKESDLESRPVVVRFYIFAPYSSYKDGKVSLESFFTPKRDYEQIRFLAQEYWETHTQFQNFLVGSSTNKKCEPYEDYEDCHWKEVCSKKYFTVCWQEWVCKQKNYCVTGQDFGVEYSSPISDLVRSEERTALSVSSYNSSVWNQANEYLGDPANPDKKTNIEKFLKGSGGGGSEGGGGGKTINDELNTICEVADAYNIDCNFFKAIYAVETCSGTYTADWVKDQCCNAEGFCGAMQFPGGMLEIVAPGEGLKVCKTEKQGMDNFILGARWMLIKKWCNSDPETCNNIPDPYKWKPSYVESQGNSAIKTKEKVEKWLIGWYPAYNQPMNQVDWPAGASYIDAVMEYLSSGSLWGQCAYQEPS